MDIDINKPMTLKAGHGYWETTYYPIGGAFRRAPVEGLNIVYVIRTFPMYKGCNAEGYVDQIQVGPKVAFDLNHCDQK